MTKRDIENCRLSFEHYRYILEQAEEHDYEFLNCYEYFTRLNDLPEKFVILRHDIEHYPEKAVEFARIEHDLGATSSYYVRVHAKRYNIYNFLSYNNLREIMNYGHEIGLHTEAMDFHATSGEKPLDIFKKELDFLKLVLDREIIGVCPHNDWTEYNNIDFFKLVNLADFGIKYQTYQQEFFEDNFYVSDGQHYYWKNYSKGILLNQRSCPCKIIKNDEPRIYILSHGMNWFRNEFHLY